MAQATPQEKQVMFDRLSAKIAGTLTDPATFDIYAGVFAAHMKDICEAARLNSPGPDELNMIDRVDFYLGQIFHVLHMNVQAIKVAPVPTPEEKSFNDYLNSGAQS